MARVIVGSYMVRYPLGGMRSWVLQYLTGFQRLGHEVTFVEKSGYANACYDPIADVMSDDPARGVAAVEALLGRHGMGSRWCSSIVPARTADDPRAIEAIFSSADLFVDMGTRRVARGGGADRDARAPDGEPAFTQMKMENRAAAGRCPVYDATTPRAATAGSPAPTAGRSGGTSSTRSMSSCSRRSRRRPPRRSPR
jgi:hypothetical protein